MYNMTSHPPLHEAIQLPQWVFEAHELRKRVFLRTVEPIIVALLGPVEEEDEYESSLDYPPTSTETTAILYRQQQDPYSLDEEHFDDVGDAVHRRLASFLPDYIQDVSVFRETSMSFASLVMLFVIMSCLFFVFVSCFYHSQKTSPLFISPRRHRLPKLVPPPLPVDGFFSWVKVCFFLSDEEIINRIGYDSLTFLRFHRLALRCIVKMSVFSFIVLLPLNFTGGGHANASDLKGYVGSLLFTDFLRFTMANVQAGSPRLWVHCFAAYLLTGIVVRELLVEYEAFNGVRHRYLLSREPHLRTVLVSNIPRHLRAPDKIETYFRHVYPQAVKSVTMCQNLIRLEYLINQRTKVLTAMESELLLLCRTEKRKLFQQSKLQSFKTAVTSCTCLESLGVMDGHQERLTKLYCKLEDLNSEVELEQRRRHRVMKKLNKMEAWEGRRDIDYLLASPFITDDPKQRRVLEGDNKKKKKKKGSSDGSEEDSYRPPSIGAPRNPDGTLRKTPPPDAKTSSNDTAASTKSKLGGNVSPQVHFATMGHGPSSSNAPGSHSGAGPVLRSNVSTQSVKGSLDDDDGPEYSAFGESDAGENKKSQKPFQKAEQSIKRYSRLDRDVSFLGRPVESTLAGVIKLDDKHIENHINEVSDKAFVVMNTFTASTIAMQSMHSSRPGSMKVSTAPEPRDVLWENIYISKGAARTRSYIGEAFVLLIITFYVVPVALVSLLVSESALVSSSPRLAQLARASAFFSTAISMVQPLCIVGIQQLLPPFFIAIGRAEGLVSFSEVQMRAFSRYFLFQVVNVFLVTTIAGSIFDTVAIIIENPERAFEMLGNSLPRMSSFFITFVTIKTFLGLGVELVRIMSLVQSVLRYILFPNATLRLQRACRIGMRAIDDPGWFPFHKILAQDMLVVVISVVFAVVAPLVLLPCALFCLFSRIMWTHHHLYVYESVFETGGQFWPKIFRRFIFGLIIAQMTITGQFILKEARHEAYSTIALMFMTYFFLRSTRARYDPSSSTLPLEVATVMDISLGQEEDAMKRARESQQPESETPTGAAKGTAGSIPDSTDVHHETYDQHLGTRIGRYDPFALAYVQPALRANPRAKPEQPFPPSQLGREDILLGRQPTHEPAGSMGKIGEDDVCDSGATVRLKSLNQQDRRLVNRWWSDQLQRCGEQNLLAVLIGEECGTLMIGRRTNLVELSDREIV